MQLKNIIKPFLGIFGLGLLLTLPTLTNAKEVAQAQQPKKIIIMVGDGMGPAYTSAYRYYKDNPDTPNIETTIFDRLLVGMASTYPARESGYITDSAASATALATGEKSYNGAISVDINKRPIKTIMEIAKVKGMATGVAVTSQVNHATPAAFLSHNESRRNYKEIAKAYLNTDADVILGGGQRYFSETLLAQFKEKGYQHITEIEQLHDIKHPPVIGLFADVQLDWEKDHPHQKLSKLTQKSLTLLNQNEKGFVLLVEGSLIDWAGHSNDVTTAMAEVEEFANSIAIVERFVNNNSDALMVVTADHNTGGLSIAANGEYAWRPEVLHKISATPRALTNKVIAAPMWARRLEQALGFELTEDEIEGLTKIKARTFKESQAIDNNATNNDKALDEAAIKALKEKHKKGITADLTDAIKGIIDRRSNTGWTSSGHTGVDVQIFAKGKSAELFTGHMDNTDIAKLLIKQIED